MIPDNYFATCLVDLNLEKEVKALRFRISDDYKVEVDRALQHLLQE